MSILGGNQVVVVPIPWADYSLIPFYSQVAVLLLPTLHSVSTLLIYLNILFHLHNDRKILLIPELVNKNISSILRFNSSAGNQASLVNFHQLPVTNTQSSSPELLVRNVGITQLLLVKDEDRLTHSSPSIKNKKKVT